MRWFTLWLYCDALSRIQDWGQSMMDKIREIVARHSGLAVDVGALGESADLYEAGMTSFASVDLMLGLEEAFDVEFPDAMLTRKTFASLQAIADAVDKLTAQAA